MKRQEELDKMIDESRKHIEEVASGKPYVETDAHRKALQILQETGRLFIVGKPGSGKTALSYKFVKQHINASGADKCPLVVDNKLFSEISIRANDNLAIIVDDAFGKYDISLKKVREWIDLSQFIRIITSPLEIKGGNCIIMNMRKDIFGESEQMRENSIFSTSSVLDLDEITLTRDEKESIYRAYNGQTGDNTVQDLTFAKDSPVGFPQCCCIYALTRKSTCNDIGDILCDPTIPLFVELRKMKVNAPANIVVLTMVFLLEGKCPEERIQLDDTLCKKVAEFCCIGGLNIKSIDLIKAANFCTQLYLRLEENLYKFSHASIQDAVGRLLWEENTKFVLGYSKMSFIRRISTDGNGSFNLSRTQMKEFLQRLTCVFQEGQDKDLEILSDSKFLEDEEFLEHFLKEITNSGVATDTICKFVHYNLRENKPKFANLLLQENPDILNHKELLLQACEYGCLPVYSCLKILGTTFDMDVLYSAVKGAHADILSDLISTIEISDSEVRTSKQKPKLETTIFQELALSGNLPFLKRVLLETNLLCKSYIEESQIPFYGIMGHSLEIVEFRSNLNFDTNIRFGNYQESVMHRACSEGTVEIVQHLIRRDKDLIHTRDNEDYTPIFSAVIGNHLDIVGCLIENGANVATLGTNGRTILHLACWNARESIAMFLVENYPYLLQISNEYGKTSLHYAAMGGSQKLFDELISRGLDVNAKDANNYNVLHRACIEPHNENMSRYLADKFYHLIHEATKHGMSILHCSMYGGSLPLLKYFIFKKHLNVYAKTNQGRNILHEALVSAPTDLRMEIVKFLIARFPRLNTDKDNEGKSLVHFAALCGDLQVFQLVEDLKFDPMVTDGMGRNILDFARLSGSEGADLLQQYLADKYPLLIK